MVKGRVSVIIPGRCEIYFQQTIDSILDAAQGDIEIIAVVDGYVPDPPLVARDERVKIIQLDESIGQRAGYNLGVRESSGEFVMKLDAHAMVSPGFDVELKTMCGPKTLVLPEMRRLDVKNWEPKSKGRTWFMYFTLDLYCLFWRPYRKRPGVKEEKYPEALTGQGSCWFTTREWNDHIGLLDEGVGSWGKVGIEVSLRTWLCGGRQIVNKDVWQAHWFRKDDGGFPYPFSGRRVAAARDYVQKHYIFKDDAFKNQTRPFRWLIEKFAPIPGWEVYLADGYSEPRYIVYYTDHSIDDSLAEAVRSQIKKAAGSIPIISVSQRPIEFGTNICVGKKPRIYASMYEQLLEGVKATPENSIVYLCEHDVFYHSSHFVKVPKDPRAMYFNTNRYYWKPGMGTYSPARDTRPFSHGVARREYIIENAEQRLQWWRDKDPRADHVKIRWFKWKAEKPNIDVRHGNNFTKDGERKRRYYEGRDPKAVRNLAGWGSPSHAMSKVSYKGMMRFDVINRIIAARKYKSYLEIGVDKRTSLDRVRCEHKDGVDPVGRCNYVMTSDEFFANHCKQRYDLIFIDGLHIAEQVERDIRHSLDTLNPGGTIVMHDCNPITEDQQRTPRGNQRAWCGDTWKAFVRFRNWPGLSMCVVDTNNGIGIIRLGSQKPYDVPDNLDYLWFEQNRQKALNLIPVSEFARRGIA